MKQGAVRQLFCKPSHTRHWLQVEDAHGDQHVACNIGDYEGQPELGRESVGHGMSLAADTLACEASEGGEHRGRNRSEVRPKISIHFELAAKGHGGEARDDVKDCEQ